MNNAITSLIINKAEKMSDDVLSTIQALVTDYDHAYNQTHLNEAIVKAEKAYSIALNCSSCSETARKKLEFNLAVLYTYANKLQLAKSYLDLVKSSTVQFIRKHELGLLYTKLAHKLTDVEARLECFGSAAEHFAKSNNWLKYCQLQINHAELLNEQERFRESSLLADSILRATLRINDPVELSKIFVNVATVYARDAQNESKMERAKFLLKRALNFGIESKLVACIEQNLSAVCNQLGEFEESLKYVQSALGNLNQMDRPENLLLSDIKFNEGYARANLGQLEQAIEAFHFSHKYANSTNQKNLYESLESIGDCYAKRDVLELADLFYEKSVAYLMIYLKNIGLEDNGRVRRRLLSKKANVAKRKACMVNRGTADQTTEASQAEDIRNNDLVPKTIVENAVIKPQENPEIKPQENPEIKPQENPFLNTAEVREQYLTLMRNYDKVASSDATLMSVAEERPMATLRRSSSSASSESMTKEEIETLTRTTETLKQELSKNSLLTQIEDSPPPAPVVVVSNWDSEYNRDSFRVNQINNGLAAKKEVKIDNTLARKINELDIKKKQLNKSSKICVIS